MISNTSPIIVTIADDKYSVALAVMLKSVEANLPLNMNAIIYVLHRDLSDKIKEEIKKTIQPDKLRLYWIKINPDRIQDLKVDGHISIDTYYRLLIEDYFPQYSKIIYLDTDIVVNRSISELWNLQLDDTHLYAVPLASKKSGFVNGERGLPTYKLLGIPAYTRTFNAGVMVINLDLWRRDSISFLILEYLKRYKEQILWWDQDGLNAILYDKWLPLPAIWNVIPSHLLSFSTWHDSLLSKDEYQEVWNSPGIIHYAGPLKPWLPNYEGPFQDSFSAYLNKLKSIYFKSVSLELLKIKDAKCN